MFLIIVRNSILLSVTPKKSLTDNGRRSVNFKRQHEVHSYKPCDDYEDIDSNYSCTNIGNNNIPVENCPPKDASLKK